MPCAGRTDRAVHDFLARAGAEPERGRGGFRRSAAARSDPAALRRLTRRLRTDDTLASKPAPRRSAAASAQDSDRPSMAGPELIRVPSV